MKRFLSNFRRDLVRLLKENIAGFLQELSRLSEKFSWLDEGIKPLDEGNETREQQQANRGC